LSNVKFDDVVASRGVSLLASDEVAVLLETVPEEFERLGIDNPND